MANNGLDLALRPDGFNNFNKRYGLSRDPATGDVRFDATQAYGVMNSGICRRHGYWADDTHGTELFTLRNLTTRTNDPTLTQAQAMLLDGEQPLVDANLINPPTVEATQRGNALALDLRWDTPGGSKGSGTIEV